MEDHLYVDGLYMATLTNTSPNPIVLPNRTIQPGEVITDFDDKEADKLKDDLFVKAGWLKIEFKAKAK
jgi:flagella basal body P-ring formation protein FlgA